MDTRSKPTLRGKAVILRPLVATDADAMFAAVQDEEGSRLTGTQSTFTRERIERWCASVAAAEGRVDCAIVAPADGRFLGGRFHDAILMGLLRREFEAGPSNPKTPWSPLGARGA